MFCISKGLAAPVGSLLVGTAVHQDGAAQSQSHRRRDAPGRGDGGGRSLCARPHGRSAGRRSRQRQRLADGLRKLGWTVDREEVETNIFFVEPPPTVARADAIGGLLERGVLVASPYAGRTLRLATHYGIEPDHITRALDAFAHVSR